MGGKSVIDYQKDIQNIDNQILQLQQLKEKALNSYNNKFNAPQPSVDSVWSKIDNEVINCDESTLKEIHNNKEFIEVNTKLNIIVQQELLLLVKQKVESREDVKPLLEKQLEIIKAIKSKVKEDKEQELLLFTKFKEYSKLHPDATYEEFLTKCK